LVESQARLFRGARRGEPPGAHIHIELPVRVFFRSRATEQSLRWNGYVVWLIAGRCGPSVWRLD